MITKRPATTDSRNLRAFRQFVFNPGGAFACGLGFAAVSLLSACSGGGGGGGGGSSAGGSGGTTSTSTSTATPTGGSGCATSTTGTMTGGSGGVTTTSTGGSSGAPYPPGPYGYDIGSTIADYAFVGYPAPDVSTDMIGFVHLGDFYNPTGADTYSPGSPYGEGAPKPKVLFIHAAAVWSGPDNYEADVFLPSVFGLYPSCFEALDVLMDGPTPGKVATEKDAFNWATKYEATYPVTIDPAAQLQPIFSQQAFPTNILIDTSTMTIVDVLAGVPDDMYLQNKVSPLCP